MWIVGQGRISCPGLDKNAIRCVVLVLWTVGGVKAAGKGRQEHAQVIIHPRAYSDHGGVGAVDTGEERERHGPLDIL